MDFADLLKLKQQGLFQATLKEINAVKLAGVSEALEEEFQKGDQADQSKIDECLQTISSTLYPDRAEQVAAQLAEGTAGKRMLLVCDFIAVPYTFNILVFLFVANAKRLEKGCDWLDIAFVGHASDPGILHQRHHNLDVLKRRFRTLANNMGIAATRLLPSVGSTFFFDNRSLFYQFLEASKSEYEIFPEYYYPPAPILKLSDFAADEFCYSHLIGEQDPDEVLTLAPPEDELETAKRWLRKNVYPEVPVTLTLRNIGFESEKNSDVELWQTVVTKLADVPIKFLIVPDYYDTYRPEAISGDNVLYCDPAALSLPLRAAFYSAVTFNIFGNNGPLTIGILSQTINYLIYLDFTLFGSSTAQETLLGEGLSEGDQYWGAGEFQRVIWETKEVDNIVESVRDMVSEMQACGKFVPDWYAD